MYTEKILQALGRDYNEIIKKKHGKCKEIVLGEIIESFIKYEIIKDSAKHLEIGVQTLNRTLTNTFPDINLNGQKTWSFYLLELINHKKCHQCNLVKPFIDFCIDRHNTLGLKSKCKNCTNKNQLGRDYSEAFIKSQEKNRDKIYARNAQYRAERLLRRPNWYEQEEIQEVYIKCPEGYQVDHELPLKGELVSGLHVLGNLQYLTIEENLSKGNRIDLDEYNRLNYGT